MSPGRKTNGRTDHTPGDPSTRWRDRVNTVDWETVRADLDDIGCALTGPLLSADEATEIAALYPQDARFRSTVDMGRHRFGEGQYRYFTEPFPEAGPVDWNALHRDLYGELVFPLQIVINLNRPGIDHTGGEFLLYEQRPRAQSRGTATLIPHGHGLVFTTRDRPVPSRRGWSAAPVRHGVWMIRSGTRFTLGLHFHDAA